MIVAYISAPPLAEARTVSEFLCSFVEGLLVATRHADNIVTAGYYQAKQHL